MNTCYSCSIGKHMACLYKGRSLSFCDCDTCNQIYADAQADLSAYGYDQEIIEDDYISNGSDL